MSPKDATLQIAQERDHVVVDADNHAMVEDNWYAANNGLDHQDIRMTKMMDR
jgi:hypothetical protein